ncbi:hypothetical protein CHELA40_14082 [Chelatococcus asaccharovorans]|nr:hypothetical protein CHELA17_61542 [Chelatococcus asaccharovorans]CAH1675042.1 hypothetical protein CHELA40_14082 [Chelatococcus asaccharovorans]
MSCPPSPSIDDGAIGAECNVPKAGRQIASAGGRLTNIRRPHRTMARMVQTPVGAAAAGEPVVGVRDCATDPDRAGRQRPVSFGHLGL